MILNSSKKETRTISIQNDSPLHQGVTQPVSRRVSTDLFLLRLTVHFLTFSLTQFQDCLMLNYKIGAHQTFYIHCFCNITPDNPDTEEMYCYLK